MGKDTTKKVIILFSVVNINHLWCLRKIERPYESRVRQQYLHAVLPQQLQARLFTLSANRGVTFALGYLHHLKQESKIPLWVYCCGAEMGLARQLPERAQSRILQLGDRVIRPGAKVGGKVISTELEHVVVMLDGLGERRYRREELVRL